MEKKTNNIGCGGFLMLLTLLFIGLKLAGEIAWNWFWVLSPMIFSFCFGLVFLAIAIISKKD